MTTEEIIAKAKSEDREDLYFELKESRKYINENGDFTLDSLLEQVVAFANREGGRLIIGIKDDGSPEGKGVFARCHPFEPGKAFDKFKGAINNICTARISPIINLAIEHHENDKYEFMEVLVAKHTLMPHAVVRKTASGQIVSRKYYIRTSHSRQTVSDTQLEWLFNSLNRKDEEKSLTLNITTDKYLKGIPTTAKNYEELLILQPRAVNILQEYIVALSDAAKKQCLSKKVEFRKDLLSEILIYGILQSYNFDKNKIEMTKDTIFFPLPPDDFIMKKAFGRSAKSLFAHSSKSIDLPDSKISISKKGDEEGPDYIYAEISNPYIKIELKLYHLTYLTGLAYHNPYYSIVLENHVGIRDTANEKYESYTYRLESRITRMFPEVMTRDYYTSYDFAKDFNEKLIKNWDINYFMKNYPHINRIYSVEYKLDRLLKLLDKPQS
jgi:hypothetical protein